MPPFLFFFLFLPITCFCENLIIDFSDEVRLSFNETGTISIYSIINNEKAHFFNVKLNGIGTNDKLNKFERPIMQISDNTVTYKWNKNVTETWKWQGNLLQRYITIYENPFSSNIDNLSVFSPYETDLGYFMVSNYVSFSSEKNRNLNISLNLYPEELVDANCLPIETIDNYGKNGNGLSYSYKNNNINYPITFYHDFEVNEDYKKSIMITTALNDNTLAISYDYNLVKLYEKKNGKWNYIKSITPIVPVDSENTNYEGYFGKSLAIDNNTLIIGAPSDTEDDSQCTWCSEGSVYIYIKDNGEWKFKSRIFGSKKLYSEFFGESVDLDGDDLVIGDPSSLNYHNDKNNRRVLDVSNSEGVVYVFKRTNNDWHFKNIIKPLNTVALDNSIPNNSFGKTVAIDKGTIAIGGTVYEKKLNKHDVNNPYYSVSHGLVYMYERENNNWVANGILKKKPLKRKRNNHKFTTYYPNYGKSISIDNNNLIIGNPPNYLGSEKAYFLNSDPETKFSFDEFGSVDIYTKKRKHWKKQTSLVSAVPYDYYGDKVKLIKDTLLIGAYGDSIDSSGINPIHGKCNAPNSGAVNIYKRSKNKWEHTNYVKSPNTSAFEHFGKLIDYDGDNIVILADKAYLYSIDSTHKLKRTLVEK